MNNSSNGGSRLATLAEQLRLYKPPATDDGVVSEVGILESATPVVVDDSQKFRPKKAAVLICLFEGEKGLRVILTKRSSTLSTHSGIVLQNVFLKNSFDWILILGQIKMFIELRRRGMFYKGKRITRISISSWSKDMQSQTRNEWNVITSTILLCFHDDKLLHKL